MCRFLISLFCGFFKFHANERRLWYQAVLCRVQPLHGFPSSTFSLFPHCSEQSRIPGRSLQFSGFGHLHCSFVAFRRSFPIKYYIVRFFCIWTWLQFFDIYSIGHFFSLYQLTDLVIPPIPPQPWHKIPCFWYSRRQCCACRAAFSLATGLLMIYPMVHMLLGWRVATLQSCAVWVLGIGLAALEFVTFFGFFQSLTFRRCTLSI